jgi:NADP-dependent 3-hydroxy acid dehydrogenase YdfG
MNLDKKIAIVSGAGKGLGAAITQALVQKNVTVYGIARDENALQQLKKSLGSLFHPAVLDITNEAAVNTWIQNQFSATHLPDILINNAGIGSFHKVDETDTATWLAMMNTNLNGMFYLTAAVAALMKQQQNSTSHIINIGSILGKTGKAESTAYCATKFGVQGFSEALMLELRHFNIKVTCVNPGSIATDFFKTSGITSHENMLQPEALADTIVHVLETPDNMLIQEMTLRPLNPKAPQT